MNHDLEGLNVFLHVAQLRSFRKAGQQLGVSASAVSHAMGKLEDQLGLRLLNRTTRSVSPTPAGARLLAALAPALAGIDMALDSLNEERTQLRGRVRINVPRPAAWLVIAPRLAEWAHLHPQLELEVVSSDAVVDIVAEGFDAGIRFGELLQQDMVAVPVGEPVRFAVCAAPGYVAAHGTPATPQDLLAHQCIGLRFPSGARYRWEFRHGNEPVTVATGGTLLLDDMACIVQAAIDGAGICYTYEHLAAPHVAAGRLQFLLQDCMPPAERFYLYFPGGRNMPAGLRALVDFLKDG
ncbi:LysR family transcriptional regulator [Massilia sp. PAMC28688]|uniref:LysR family transcriptional regulator n=1 Tax=Massilia sp. PAMC28688 TaxID=2861283 RepID=UPI001C63B666|nr:LysR family transcriptional regulator [Massilia sp. PAMC28688]QYF95221.1 LysR family transcriptional regulator [Massilia sp. PAMC28688]